MPKPKHVHTPALRLKPRPPLQEVYCTGCLALRYTVEPAEGVELAMDQGHLIAVKPKRRKR
jgi:hypothetical protein